MKKPGKTLVVGAKGFIGRGFLDAYIRLFPDTIGTDYRAQNPIERLDLSSIQLDHLPLKSAGYREAVIVAGNTDLALCEQEKGKLNRLNVEATLELSREFVRCGIKPIVFSTAYVFDGEEGGYDENSPTNPINEYGRQKETLEKQMRRVCGDDYLMIRCSKVFDFKKGGGTLLEQIGTDLLNGRSVRAAIDQIFNPILLEDLVGAVISLQTQEAKGLYNICSDEVWNRLDLARAIATQLGVKDDLVKPITLDEVKMPFKLPKKTNMSCAKFHDQVDFAISPLSMCIKELSTLYGNLDDR